MTEVAPSKGHAARRPRLSKRALRTWAWIAGAAAVFAPLGLIAAQPKVTAALADPGGPRQVIVRKTVRRVIVVSPKAPTPPQRVIYVGGGSAGGGSAVAPVTTTGGSAPPP